MHAMIVDSRPSRLDLTQIAFLEAGIHVTGSGSLAVADCCLRRAVVDLLVLDADVAGRRTGEIIALAERRNPKLVTLVLTQNVAGVTDTYTEVFQSVHCVLEADVPPAMVARMAQASLAGRTIARVAAAKSVAPVAETVETAQAAPGPQPDAAKAAVPTQGTVAEVPQPWPDAPDATDAATVGEAHHYTPVGAHGSAPSDDAPRPSALAQMVASRPASAGEEGPAPVFATRRRRISPHHQLMAVGA